MEFFNTLDLSLSLTAIKNDLQGFFWDHIFHCFDPDDVCIPLMFCAHARMII